MVSVELAMMIVDSMQSEREEDINLYYLDSAPLKGVLNNCDYPLFWIGDHQPKTGSLHHPCDPVKTAKFCEAFFTKENLCRPFITTDQNPRYKEPPEDTSKKRQLMIEERQNRKNTDSSGDDTERNKGEAQLPQGFDFPSK